MDSTTQPLGILLLEHPCTCGTHMQTDLSSFFLQNIERIQTFCSKIERNILLKQLSQKSNYLGEVFDESSIKTCMPNEASNSLYGGRRGKFSIASTLALFTVARYFMAQDYPFLNHKITFLPIQHQVCFLTMNQDPFQIYQTKFK